MLLQIVVLILVSAFIPSISGIPYQEIPEMISNDVESLKTSTKIPETLAKLINDTSRIKNVQISNEIFCQTCDLVMTQIITYRRSGANKDSIADFFRKLCNVFTDWGDVACQGFIDIELDTVIYIIDNKVDLTSSRVCAIAFQQRSCVDPAAVPWSINIPPKNQTRIDNPANPITANATSLKILHLTDFHYDPLYEAGCNADCGLPLCCQKSNGPPVKPGTAAGFWGDYHSCDTPWYSITNFTTYLTGKNESYDLVYYTGDIISHRSWATTKDDNIKSIKQLFQLFNETFKKTPVIAILGNHEPHPTDFYSPDTLNNTKLSTQWIFNVVASEWSRWLPAATNQTILKGGYYTVLIRPGFRIVALNSNVCFLSNLWLIYDDQDPYGQLAWLVKTLTDAEKNNETVHILSHIPPGEILCLQTWAYQFRRIVDRFAAIIVAQFNGHTHMDELRLFRDSNDTKKIVNVAYNGGSFTTFVGFNPNYRVYDVDNNTLQVVDYDQFTYNLTAANLNTTKTPAWFKLYSFKDAYGLTNTSYENLADLTVRMSKNHTLVQKYFRYQGRESAPHLAQGCDDKCLERLLCGITAVEANESVRCQQLTANEFFE